MRTSTYPESPSQARDGFWFGEGLEQLCVRLLVTEGRYWLGRGRGGLGWRGRGRTVAGGARRAAPVSDAHHDLLATFQSGNTQARMAVSLTLGIEQGDRPVSRDMDRGQGGK